MGEFYDAAHTDEAVEDVIVDGNLEGYDLDAAMDDLKIIENNMTNEKEHWQLRKDLVSIQAN